MLTALAVLVVAGVGAAFGSRRVGRRRRLRSLSVASVEPDPQRYRRGRRVAISVAAFGAAVVGIGGVWGIAIGVVAAAGIVATGGVTPAPPEASATDAAIVVELIAGCLAAGLTMPDSLEAAAVAGDPVTADACRATAAALRAGADGSEAWQGWRRDPSLACVARLAARTTATGAAAADDLRRAAARLRALRRARLAENVQRASVWVVVPLGLCFLPAFVLVAVVPVVAGLFGSML